MRVGMVLLMSLQILPTMSFIMETSLVILFFQRPDFLQIFLNFHRMIAKFREKFVGSFIDFIDWVCLFDKKFLVYKVWVFNWRRWFLEVVHELVGQFYLIGEVFIRCILCHGCNFRKLIKRLRLRLIPNNKPIFNNTFVLFYERRPPRSIRGLHLYLILSVFILHILVKSREDLFDAVLLLKQGNIVEVLYILIVLLSAEIELAFYFSLDAFVFLHFLCEEFIPDLDSSFSSYRTGIEDSNFKIRWPRSIELIKRRALFIKFIEFYGGFAELCFVQLGAVATIAVFSFRLLPKHGFWWYLI